MYRISDSNSRPQGTEEEFIESGTTDPAVTNRLLVAENLLIFKIYKQNIQFSGFFLSGVRQDPNQQTKKYYLPSVGTGINPLRGFIPVIYSHNGNNIREDASQAQFGLGPDCFRSIFGLFRIIFGLFSDYFRTIFRLFSEYFLTHF